MTGLAKPLEDPSGGIGVGEGNYVYDLNQKWAKKVPCRINTAENKIF